MADSVRKQVIDAIAAVVLSSTGVTTVETNLKNWFDYQAHKFPVVTVLDRDTDIERLCFKESSRDDKIANMSVLIRGYVFDQNNDTSAKRTGLIRDIQVAIETGSTAMNALIFDIPDISIETDDGIIDNYSIFDITYNVQYHYNHLTP